MRTDLARLLAHVASQLDALPDGHESRPVLGQVEARVRALLRAYPPAPVALPREPEEGAEA